MKRISYALLSFLLIFFVTVPAFAVNEKVPVKEYNPKTMSIEERAQWVDENIPPVYFQAEKDRSEWSFTALNSHYIYDNGNNYIGGIRTNVKFLCNDSLTRVEDTATVQFSALSNGYPTDTEYGRTWIYPDNVRVWYTVWIATPSGAAFVDHWYNLYANGTYSLRVVHSNILADW